MIHEIHEIHISHLTGYGEGPFKVFPGNARTAIRPDLRGDLKIDIIETRDEIF